MTFADIPDGTDLFIEANPLIYYLGNDPAFGPSSIALMARVMRGDIRASTSVSVLADVTHRVMLIEAARRNHWPTAGALKRLQQQPDLIQQLGDFQQQITSILASSIEIMPEFSIDIADAMTLSIQYGLLTNDARIVAVMNAHGLTHLASNDTDFDRVPGLTRYAPV